jgi:uncharacterized protein
VSRAIICVFAKAPAPGGAKTRLIPLLGAAGAADLARAFLQDTWAAMTAVPRTRAVITTPGDLWAAAFAALEPAAEVWDQGPADLGDRMERMMRRGHELADAALCVGTDSPGLPPDRLEQALAALKHHDAVLGPAEDGGYFLIGLRHGRCPEGLLADLPWSQEDTMARTRERLEQRGLTVALTEPWFDVDLPGDVERLREMLRSGEIKAPHTAEALNLTRLKP